MNRGDDQRIVLVSHRIYQALLIAYPRDIRRAFGWEMAQVFRTACRETMRAQGGVGLVMLWVRTVIDLLVTASRERSLALWQRSFLLRCGMAAAAIVLACLARYLHGATDADGITLVLVAGGSLLWGAVWSHRRRSWPLLIGLGVFALVVIGYSWSIGGRSDGDVDTPSALMSIQLLLAGYLGTLMSRAVAQRAPSDSGFQS